MKKTFFKIVFLFAFIPAMFGQTPPETAPFAPQSTQVKNDTIPPQKARLLTYQFKGPFTLYFNNDVAAGSIVQIVPVITTGKEKNTRKHKKLTINQIEFAAITTGDAVTEQKKLAENLKWVFHSRGLQLQKTADFADAVFWGAFLIEMMLETQVQQYGDIMRIQGTDSNGNAVVFSWAELQHYPIKQPESPKNGNN